MRLSDPGAPARHGHGARHALARVPDAARRQLRARRLQAGPAGLRHRRAAPCEKAVPEVTATGAPVQNDALPAECLILVFKPGECALKMLRIKIWPIFIPDIEIRINRLHREKTAQSASSSPAYNQIQT